MKGIVGKKLGMTQVFDAESGVVTPVTVIEAAPCPVVAGQDRRADGYEAVQLAYEQVADAQDLEARARPPRRRPASTAPTATSSSSAAATRLGARRDRHGRGFQPGDKVKVSGIAIGKGFQGTIKRHNFKRGPKTHGSHNVRTPGSIGASATPSRVFKGMKMAGPDGRQARDPGRPRRPRGRPGAEPAARQGRRARAEERLRRGAGGDAVMAAPKAPCSIGGQADEGRHARGRRLRRRGEAAPRARDRAGRAERRTAQGTRAAKSRGLVAGGRAKPWRQKGTGRARAGTIRAAAVHGRRRRLPAEPAHFEVKVNRKARRCRPARRALEPRPGRHARRPRRVRRSRRRRRRPPSQLLADVGQGDAACSSSRPRTRPA